MRVAALALLLIAGACSKQDFPPKPPTQRSTAPLQEHRKMPSLEQEPMRVGGEVTAPVAIRRVEPKFSAGFHAKTFFLFEEVITKDGDVKSIRSLRGPDDADTRAAIEALRQWKFRPGKWRGQSVDVIYNITVRIELR